jgi:hypothetical protein
MTTPTTTTMMMMMKMMMTMMMVISVRVGLKYATENSSNKATRVRMSHLHWPTLTKVVTTPSAVPMLAQLQL